MLENAYSLNEAARLLGIAVRTARSWVKSGKMKAAKISDSNRWFVTEQEIKRLRHEDVHED